MLKESTQRQQDKWYINLGDEIWFLVIYISKRINLNRKLNSGRVKWIKICLIYNQMKEGKSKTLLLATSKQIREAAWQDGHQRTKCFETSNVMLLLLLWHGDFSLENFFQDCFPSFLSYFVYVSLTPRRPHPPPLILSQSSCCCWGPQMSHPHSAFPSHTLRWTDWSIFALLNTTCRDNILPTDSCPVTCLERSVQYYFS